MTRPKPTPGATAGRRLLGWTLACALVSAAAGCGAGHDGASAGEEGATRASAPGTATGAVEGPPAATGAVEVLDPGEGAPMAWPQGAGAKRTLTVPVVLPVVEGDGAGVPVRLVVAAERAEASRGAESVWFFSIRTAESLAAPEGSSPEAVLRALAGIAVAVGRYDPFARRIDYEQRPKGPASEAVAAALGRAVGFLTPPVPEGGARPGARWRVRRHDGESVFEVVRDGGGRPVVRVVVRGTDGADLLALHVRAGPPGGAGSDRLAYRGDPVSGAVLFAQAVPGAEVTVAGRDMPVSQDGRFLVGLGRTPQIPTLVRVRFPDGTALVHALAPVRRSFEEEAIDGLDEEDVHPPRAVRRALKKVRKEIAAARLRRTTTPYFDGEFLWPARGRITSTYGRKRILNGEPRGYHWGVDIGAPVGRPVVAPAAGEVVFARRNVPLAGHMVILDHGLGLSSSFLHLSRIHVREGQRVEKGQRIGRVGKTGRATGPHLDWRMNVLDVRVDPALLASGSPEVGPR